MLEQLGVDPFDADLGPVGDAAVDQRFAQAFVGVGKADIFADHADRDLAFGMVDAVHDFVPPRHSGRGASSMRNARSTSSSSPAS